MNTLESALAGIEQMTPEQVNRAIANLCGWTVSEHGWWSHPTLPDGGGAMTDAPYYFYSLDAMARAEATLNEEESRSYSQDLFTQALKTGFDLFLFRSLTTTAAQRARAFLRVKTATILADGLEGR